MSKVQNYVPDRSHRTWPQVPCESVYDGITLNDIILGFKQEAGKLICLKNIGLGGLGLTGLMYYE